MVPYLNRQNSALSALGVKLYRNQQTQHLDYTSLSLDSSLLPLNPDSEQLNSVSLEESLLDSEEWDEDHGITSEDLAQAIGLELLVYGRAANDNIEVILGVYSLPDIISSSDIYSSGEDESDQNYLGYKIKKFDESDGDLFFPNQDLEPPFEPEELLEEVA